MRAARRTVIVSLNFQYPQIGLGTPAPDLTVPPVMSAPSEGTSLHPEGEDRSRTAPARSMCLELATTSQVAEELHTTVAALAQMRYMGTGPKFIKCGRKVLYRWSDVQDWLDSNTQVRTDG